MKPLMLIPPAQAEALNDAHEEAPTGDRFAPPLWLDDDSSEEDPRLASPTRAANTQDRRLSRRWAA